MELQLEELRLEGAPPGAPLRKWRRRILTPQPAEEKEQLFLSSSPFVRSLVRDELEAAFKSTRLPALQAAGLSGRLRRGCTSRDQGYLHVQLPLPQAPAPAVDAGAGCPPTFACISGATPVSMAR